MSKLYAMPMLFAGVLALALSGCSKPATPAPAPEAAAPAAEMKATEEVAEVAAAEAPASEEPAKEEHGEEHDHDHDDDHDHDHTHEPMRGGTLVEVGDHVAHLEVLFDAESGKLTFYAMDAHVENPVRLASESIAVTVDLRDGNPPLSLSLAARANTLTGETVGDTSEFVVEDERLKGFSAFDVTVPMLDIRGVPFENITFPFPEGVQ